MAGGTPRYGELPVVDDGLRSAWGVWGPDDDLGTVNRIDDAVVAAAAREEIRSGERISLSLPVDEPDPPFFGRGLPSHRIMTMASGAQDDRLDDFFLQGSSQWDGLRHRGSPAGYWGGVSAEEAAAPGRRLGVGAWAERGIITRGVLADVAGFVRASGRPWSPFDPEPISADLISETLDHQATTLWEGDVLLVRTGYIDDYRALPRDRRAEINASGRAAGLEAGDSMAEYLWDSGICAVATDTPALEVAPRDPGRPTLHARLLPLLGFALGELFTLEELARVSAADRRWTFFFVSVPLNLPAGVGSPTNAVAIR